MQVAEFVSFAYLNPDNEKHNTILTVVPGLIGGKSACVSFRFSIRALHFLQNVTFYLYSRTPHLRSH